MKKIVFLTALLSIVSITNAQDRQEAIRTQNVQKSWVKNIPFQALPLTRGAGEIIQIERNPKDPYQSIAVEVFAELITPTPQLLTALQNARASDAEDLYRQGY